MNLFICWMRSILSLRHSFIYSLKENKNSLKKAIANNIHIDNTNNIRNLKNNNNLTILKYNFLVNFRFFQFSIYSNRMLQWT